MQEEDATARKYVPRLFIKFNYYIGSLLDVHNKLYLKCYIINATIATIRLKGYNT